MFVILKSCQFHFCYKNDLPSALTRSSAFLYADDTILLVKGKSIGEINVVFQLEMSNISRWFSAKKCQLINQRRNPCFSVTLAFVKRIPLWMWQQATRSITQLSLNKYRTTSVIGAWMWLASDHCTPSSEWWCKRWQRHPRWWVTM